MVGFPAHAPAGERRTDIVVGISADLTITQVRLALVPVILATGFSRVRTRPVHMRRPPCQRRPLEKTIQESRRMTESNRPRTLRALTLIVGGAIVGALVAAAAVTAVVTSVGPATPSASPAPTEQTRFTRPDDWSDYRPAVHLTPAERWMNDPQRPFLLDGVWHYYYLYNADYPEGNGTEWYHTTSTDLVHWEDHGVAIEKYENGLGDIETGSAVVDVDNTAGFGKGAVVAVMTQQHEGVQRQSLFVSTDGGYRFESYDANPVMENPGEQHWRDPKIVWDDDRSEWLMVLAEGHKIGFYTSPTSSTGPTGRDSNATTSGSSNAPTCSACRSTAIPRTRNGCSRPARTVPRTVRPPAPCTGPASGTDSVSPQIAMNRTGSIRAPTSTPP